MGGFATSNFTPATTLVLPIFTKDEPSAVVIEPIHFYQHIGGGDEYERKKRKRVERRDERKRAEEKKRDEKR